MNGTVYHAVMEKVEQLPFVQGYFKGALDKAAFHAELENNRGLLISLGLNDWWISLLSRFPNDQWQGAAHLLKTLHSHGLTDTPPDIDRFKQGFASYERQAGQSFSHLPDRFTSIFPEEARIAYTLSRAIKPGNVFVAGSYYGYLAVWLIPGMASGGRMLCSDVDPVVCKLAQKNMESMGECSRVSVRCEDAEKLLLGMTGMIDLFVLDAYGSHDHKDSRYHGKSIYGPLLRAAFPRLHENSILLVHNAEKGSKDLEEFFSLVERARFAHFLDTTENMAVFWI